LSRSALPAAAAGTDGAAGIVEIERLGGHALVQDPRQASSPSMPKAALAADSPECLSIEDIAVRVTEFCSHPSAAQRLHS
jgi:chemotaxis response regulator CheB